MPTSSGAGSARCSACTHRVGGRCASPCPSVALALADTPTTPPFPAPPTAGLQVSHDFGSSLESLKAFFAELKVGSGQQRGGGALVRV
jgi:hypothetical protein